MKSIIYHHFGLPADPWERHQKTADAHRIGLAVQSAFKGGALVEIVGQRGSGKTHAAWQALTALDATVIEPLRLDKENLHIGDIQRAIIETLGDETPRHSAEARAGQVRRLLVAAGNQGAVLLIDESHCLHHQTLRALKRLRELGARGKRKSLLPIILLGQRAATASAAEVALRTHTLTLAGLTRAEAEAAIKATLGAAVESAAAKAIAASPAAGNWLELERACDDALTIAMADGETRLTAATVRKVLGADPGAEPAAATGTAPAPGQVAEALGNGGRRRVG